MKKQDEFRETWKWHVVDGISPSTEDNGLIIAKRILSRVQLTNPTDENVLSLSFFRSSHRIFVFLFISLVTFINRSIQLVPLISVCLFFPPHVDGSETFILFGDHKETLHFFTDRVAGAIMNPKDLPMVV